VQAWFDSGAVLDLALGLLLLEAVALLALRGRSALPTVATLAAGGCVLLAWRLSMLGLGWPWIGAALLAGLGCHLGDLAIRLARQG
jgi:hypothetical protein